MNTSRLLRAIKSSEKPLWTCLIADCDNVLENIVILLPRDAEWLAVRIHDAKGVISNVAIVSTHPPTANKRRQGFTADPFGGSLVNPEAAACFAGIWLRLREAHCVRMSTGWRSLLETAKAAVAV